MSAGSFVRQNSRISSRNAATSNRAVLISAVASELIPHLRSIRAGRRHVSGDGGVDDVGDVGRVADDVFIRRVVHEGGELPVAARVQVSNAPLQPAVAFL